MGLFAKIWNENKSLKTQIATSQHANAILIETRDAQARVLQQHEEAFGQIDQEDLDAINEAKGAGY